MQKIVFFDIDGTLVGPSDIILPSALRAIQALRKRGVKTAIATGRSALEMKDFKETHPVELFDILIYGNGSQTEMDGKVISKQYIDPQEVADIIRVARQHDIVYGVLDDQTMRISVESHPQLDLFLDGAFAGKPELYDPDFHLTNAIYSGFLLADITKAPLFDPVLKQCEVVQGVKVGGVVGNHLDFWRKDVHKATAIRQVVELLGMGMEQVYAVGDGSNDVDMLREAGVGIAMGNAEPDVQEAADFVTKPYDQGGIEYAMKHFGLI